MVEDLRKGIVMRMFKTLSACALAITVIAGCSTAPKNQDDRAMLRREGESAIDKMAVTDSSLKPFLDRSYAYVVFPEVGKGGLIVGAAYGHGVVYEKGVMVGYADVSKATVGLQAGGQTFTEIIAFENKNVLDRFKNGNLKFSANVSAVLLKSGAADSAKFSNGIAVFVQPLGGAMVEASIGGQSFSYIPKESVANTDTREMN